ncbi:MAG: DUF3280 domain-containing protein [Xanthobacteraceae bacterium]
MWNRSKTLIALTLASTVTTAVHAAEHKVAVFDFEFVDTSLEGAANGPRIDEKERLAWLGSEMRRRLAQSGRAEIVDVASIAGRVHARNLRTCGGCDADFASELGARYSITGWVQKVSNLILNMNILVRDVGTGDVVLSKSVDMRGNTDESWSRALDWLVRRYLLAPNEGVF